VLVEPGDVDQLEHAIRRLLDDPAYAATLGRAARERFISDLSSVPLAERFERFFRRIGMGETDADDAAADRVLSAREAATIDLSDRAAVTVIVRAEEPARLRILDGGERTLDLAAAERRRIRLDVASGQAKLVVERGRACVERVVTVLGDPISA